MCGCQSHENRIYMLSITAGPNYPNEPPVIRFNSKINMTGINMTNGDVDAKAIIPNWNIECGIETFLVAIRQNMVAGANRTKAQPPEGSEFR